MVNQEKFKKYKIKGLILNFINKIFYQLNEELKAMKIKNYIHIDSKPANILIKYMIQINIFIILNYLI